MMTTAETTPLSSRERKAWLVNLGRIGGAVGLVLWVSTPLTWLLTAEFGPLVWGKLVMGGLMVALYLATNADFFTRVLGARSSGLFAMSAISTLLVLGMVGIANYFAFAYPKEIDLTSEGLYTLSEQTTGLLGRLRSDVTVRAFYASYDPSYASVDEILTRYRRAAGSKLTYEMIDPQSRPDLVEKFQITERGSRLVVSSRGQDARAKEPSESELTGAIIKVAEGHSKRVAFLTGHGEGDTTDGEHAEGYKALADAVAAEGYSTAVLNLMVSDAQAKSGDKVDTRPGAGAAALQVPADVDVVAVLGPRRALMEPEVAALEAFLEHGGRIVAMLEPKVRSGLEELLATYKIEVRNDLVVDTNPLNRLLGLGAAAPMVQPDAGGHPIAKDLGAPAVLFTARSLRVASGGRGGVDAQPLAHTGESAWGETNMGKDGTAARDASDHAGPIDVAVAATRDVSGDEVRSPHARLVAFGDSDWVNNRYLTMQGNTDFVLNAINWAAEQEEKITIRPKTRAGSQLFLSGEQLGQLKFLSMDILPVILVAMGLGIVLVRRQR